MIHYLSYLNQRSANFLNKSFEQVILFQFSSRKTNLTKGIFLLKIMHISDQRKSDTKIHVSLFMQVKETRSVTMNIFRKKYFLFKSFVKIESSYIFTINMVSTAAENCKEK